MTSSSDRRVLITGGAAGIGLAIARAFRDQGARVHVFDIDVAAVGRAKTDDALSGSIVNMGDQTAVADAVSGVLADFGGLDVLVNNVGISGPSGPIETLDFDDWKQCIAINLDGSFLCLRQVVPAMKAAGSGAVINISSTAGLYGYANRSPYSAAKWAVVGLTKTLALELGPHGVRANCICPGTVDGPRMDRVIAAEASVTGRTESDIRQGYADQSAMRSFIQADEIADMAVFLASDGAGKVNGQIISVDGFTEYSGS
ncbi:MAG: SDR family oxidoreductase [Rhodospirillaceae bacterium]|nr:SDR family oxidoreductase [Rhodospirillaceae bacterium]MBT6136439.1 SDR family oxidoreductase [Rhodospirillaceae bacterium]